MSLPDGLHHISRELYETIKRVRQTGLKDLAISPAHYDYRQKQPAPDKEAWKIGRGTHLCTFEAEEFRSTYVVWDQGRRGSNKWKAFEKKHRAEGHEILTEGEHAQMLAISQAVRNNRLTAPFLDGGQGETTVLWTFRRPAVDMLPALEIECKSRLDWVATVGAIVDLKTTRCAEPRKFGRFCVDYGYDIQAAFYQDAYHAVTGKRLPYVIVAVESTPPHAITVFRVPERILRHGRDKYVGLIYRLAECRRTGTWPAYANDVVDLELPEWELPSEDVDDGDPTGIGLVFGGSEAA